MMVPEINANIWNKKFMKLKLLENKLRCESTAGDLKYNQKNLPRVDRVSQNLERLFQYSGPIFLCS